MVTGAGWPAPQDEQPDAGCSYTACVTTGAAPQLEQPEPLELEGHEPPHDEHDEHEPQVEQPEHESQTGRNTTSLTVVGIAQVVQVGA